MVQNAGENVRVVSAEEISSRFTMSVKPTIPVACGGSPLGGRIKVKRVLSDMFEPNVLDQVKKT